MTLGEPEPEPEEEGAPEREGAALEELLGSPEADPAEVALAAGVLESRLEAD